MKRWMAVFLAALLILALSSWAGQEKAKPAAEPAAKVAAPIEDGKVKAWPLPAHMTEGLNALVNAKVEEFRKFLKANVKGYDDLPDNAIFDMQNGIFLRPEDVPKIQQLMKDEAAKQAAAKTAAPVKK